MTDGIDQELAKRTVMDAVSHGQQSIPQLGCAMLAAGIPDGMKYFAARVAVSALLSERRLEPFQFDDGTMIYRLPAETQFEKPKGTP